MTPVDTVGLDAALKAITQKYGTKSVQSGSEFAPVPRIPTGSLEFDYITGGGIPIGRYSRLYGAPSSSKSLNCWKIIKHAQALGMKCVYYNIEKQFDPVFTMKHGVNVDDLIVINGTVIEEIATKMEALMGVAHVHVLDSCSQGVSTDELAAKPEDWRPGIGPRAWGKVWRRVGEVFDDAENTIILVDQVRLKWETKTEEPPGGKQMEHISSMTVRFDRGQWLFYDAHGYLVPKDKLGKAKVEASLSGQLEPAGVEIKARVQKSRVCRPFRTARFALDLNTMQFDPTYEWAKAAKHYGMVEQEGAWYTLPSGVRANGNSQLRKALWEDPALCDQLYATAMLASVS